MAAPPTDVRIRPFADVLREQAKGRTHDELSEALHQLVTDPAWKGLPARQIMRRVGKKRAGRLLDGAQHDGYPGGEA